MPDNYARKQKKKEKKARKKQNQRQEQGDIDTRKTGEASTAGEFVTNPNALSSPIANAREKTFKDEVASTTNAATNQGNEIPGQELGASSAIFKGKDKVIFKEVEGFTDTNEGRQEKHGQEVEAPSGAMDAENQHSERVDSPLPNLDQYVGLNRPDEEDFEDARKNW